jgi:prepilin-type N-terminal cleavage/methylation domain-containing protein
MGVTLRDSPVAPDRGFTLVELLTVIAIIGILVAILLPAVQAAREAARRSRCNNNLKQIGLALQLYHGAHKTLPPGGIMYGPCCSTKSYTNWAIAILPFLEEEPLYNLYDQQAFNEDNVNARVREAFVNTFFVLPSRLRRNWPAAKAGRVPISFGCPDRTRP